VMYKYLDLGRVETSGLLTLGSTTIQATPIAADLHVHTVTAGLRFGF
jgi:opacity protein-like surface antigen